MTNDQVWEKLRIAGLIPRRDHADSDLIAVVVRYLTHTQLEGIANNSWLYKGMLGYIPEYREACRVELMERALFDRKKLDLPFSSENLSDK